LIFITFTFKVIRLKQLFHVLYWVIQLVFDLLEIRKEFEPKDFFVCAV